MNTLAQRINALIARYAAGMGDYHFRSFAEVCRKTIEETARHLGPPSDDDLAAAVCDQAKAYSESVKQERERILAVMAQGKQLPGHDELIAALVADGKTTGPEAAALILDAVKRRVIH